MSTPQRTDSQLGHLLLIVGLILFGIAYAVVRHFSALLHVPIEIGGAVLLRSGIALAAAAAVGWWFFSHRRWLPISLLVLLGCLSVAFWPAIDVWAAEFPVLSLGLDPTEATLAWWGSMTTRIVVLLALFAAAVWLLINDN
ncbi:MAG: hypothetical protein IPO08_05785 [Xanthomonadales bacterium]|nr:hypothetical protein [Xanthomonadales bacterium]